MGSCASSGTSFLPNDSVSGQTSKVLKVFKALHLTKSDIDNLWGCFRDIDVDESGNIGQDELLAYFMIDSDKFWHKVLIKGKNAKSKLLTFSDFVCVIWNFCSLHPCNLSEFAFFIFSENNDRSISYDNVKDLVEAMHPDQVATRKLIAKMMNKSNSMSLEKFVSCSLEHQSILAPLLGLQSRVRDMILGLHRWECLASARANDDIMKGPDAILRIPEYVSGDPAMAKKPVTKKRSVLDQMISGGNTHKKRKGQKRKPVQRKPTMPANIAPSLHYKPALYIDPVVVPSVFIVEPSPLPSPVLHPSPTAKDAVELFPDGGVSLGQRKEPVMQAEDLSVNGFDPQTRVRSSSCGTSLISDNKDRLSRRTASDDFTSSSVIERSKIRPSVLNAKIRGSWVHPEEKISSPRIETRKQGRSTKRSRDNVDFTAFDRRPEASGGKSSLNSPGRHRQVDYVPKFEDFGDFA